jgi:hypothetical protein
MLHFICTGPCKCGNPCSAPDDLAGKRIICPISGMNVEVPEPLTERQWLTIFNPRVLLRALPVGVSARKQRLFALACCRRVEHQFNHPLSQRALDLMEEHLAGRATEKELTELSRRLWNECNARSGYHGPVADPEVIPGLIAACELMRKVWPARVCADTSSMGADPNTEWLLQGACLKCIFGNPFRPVTLAADWRTPNVTAFAQAVYDDNAFDRLPILADALEEAGCDNAEVLHHCREPGAHVRGCWVVDQLLEKE